MSLKNKSLFIGYFLAVLMLLALLNSAYFFLSMAFIPLYYYGTMGLFVVSWDRANMFSQVTHVLITLNVIWVLFVLLKESKFESIGKGLLIGVLVFVPLFAIIQSYSQLHMAEFIQLLQKVH